MSKAPGAKDKDQDNKKKPTKQQEEEDEKKQNVTKGISVTQKQKQRKKKKHSKKVSKNTVSIQRRRGDSVCISIDNFDPQNQTNHIDSPRSKEALKRLGYRERDIKYKIMEEIQQEGVPEQYENDQQWFYDLKFVHYEKRRKDRINKLQLMHDKIKKEMEHPTLTLETQHMSSQSNAVEQEREVKLKGKMDQMKRFQERSINLHFKRKEEQVAIEEKLKQKDMKLYKSVQQKEKKREVLKWKFKQKQSMRERKIASNKLKVKRELHQMERRQEESLKQAERKQAELVKRKQLSIFRKHQQKEKNMLKIQQQLRRQERRQIHLIRQKQKLQEAKQQRFYKERERQRLKNQMQKLEHEKNLHLKLAAIRKHEDLTKQMAEDKLQKTNRKLMIIKQEIDDKKERQLSHRKQYNQKKRINQLENQRNIDQQYKRKMEKLVQKNYCSQKYLQHFREKQKQDYEEIIKKKNEHCQEVQEVIHIFHLDYQQQIETHLKVETKQQKVKDIIIKDLGNNIKGKQISIRFQSHPNSQVKEQKEKNVQIIQKRKLMSEYLNQLDVRENQKREQKALHYKKYKIMQHQLEIDQRLFNQAKKRQQMKNKWQQNDQEMKLQKPIIIRKITKQKEEQMKSLLPKSKKRKRYKSFNKSRLYKSQINKSLEFSKKFVEIEEANNTYMRRKKHEIEKLQRRLDQSDYARQSSESSEYERKQDQIVEYDQINEIQKRREQQKKLKEQQRKKDVKTGNDDFNSSIITSRSTDTLQFIQNAYGVNGQKQYDLIQRKNKERYFSRQQSKQYRMRRRSLQSIKVPAILKSMVRTQYIEDFVIAGQDQEANLEMLLIELQPKMLAKKPNKDKLKKKIMQYIRQYFKTVFYLMQKLENKIRNQQEQENQEIILSYYDYFDFVFL